MGTAIKHPVPDRVKASLVIFDIRALWRSGWASECPDVKNDKWSLNPVWHRMLYSCTSMTTTVGVKGLSRRSSIISRPSTLLNVVNFVRENKPYTRLPVDSS